MKSQLGARVGLKHRSAVVTVGAATAVALGALLFACLGKDPEVDDRDRDREDTGTSSGQDGATDATTTDATTTDAIAETGPPTTVDPRCPVPPAYLACSGAVDDSAAALHLDACTLGTAEGIQTQWTPAKGPTPLGNPGALYCRGALNGRPAMVFDRDGFNIPAGATTPLDLQATSFALVTVMQYTPSMRGENAAGGLVFQRNDDGYPFAGPQITANFARQGQAGSQFSLESTTLLGGSLRFGLATDAGGPDERGIAAVAPTPIAKAVVAVLRKSDDVITFRIDGNVVATENVPNDFASFGGGNPVNIGRGFGSSNNFFLGKLGELLFYTSDPPNLAAIEQSLMTKWGITP